MEHEEQPVLRAAEIGDVPAMAALAGISAEIYKLEKHIASGLCHTLVLVEGDELIAWSMSRYLEPTTADEDHAPAGWYLMGVQVRPDRRRRGLGRLLTETRLEWLSERTDCVRYFTEADNRASVALHEALGFRSVRRRLTSRGLRFDGGPYTLFELALPIG